MPNVISIPVIYFERLLNILVTSFEAIKKNSLDHMALIDHGGIIKDLWEEGTEFFEEYISHQIVERQQEVEAEIQRQTEKQKILEKTEKKKTPLGCVTNKDIIDVIIHGLNL